MAALTWVKSCAVPRRTCSYLGRHRQDLPKLAFFLALAIYAPPKLRVRQGWRWGRTDTGIGSDSVNFQSCIPSAPKQLLKHAARVDRRPSGQVKNVPPIHSGAYSYGCCWRTGGSVMPSG